MGWSSGSQMAEELYRTIRNNLPVNTRKRVANRFIEAFENQDADDWSDDTLLWKDSGRRVWNEL